MARLALLITLLLTALLLAGCTSDGDDEDDSTTTTSTTSTQPALCDGLATGTSTVAGFTKHGGNWTALASGEGHTDVVCGIADKALSSLVQDTGSYTNLEAKVSFNMQAGDSGAGLVIHYADEKNYNIVRYSIREQGWHIFTMIEGNRQKQDIGTVAGSTTNPDLDQWVSLRVVSASNHITAFDGETKVIDYTLPEGASAGGKVGFFLRDTGMAALFDDFTVA